MENYTGGPFMLSFQAQRELLVKVSKISFVMSKRDSSQKSPLFSLDHHFKSGGVIMTPGHVTIDPGDVKFFVTCSFL